MTLLAGTRLGPYEIQSPLGAGGMGEVYRARDPRLGRDVAIKVLPSSFSADSERLRRFEQEARAASALSDPHIVTVFDVGTAEGVHFFASELVEGSSLRELLAQASLPIMTVLDLATQIASGLAAAHEKGIVHRDLKPENILVSRSGLVKIADFGLAKQMRPGGGTGSQAATSPLSLTEAGVIIGTVAYMSPEQARGEELDFRSDQFSFGVILQEMITGRQPFQRSTQVETLAAILKEDPPALSASEKLIPPALQWIVDRCLSKSPARRYGATFDLFFDLSRLKEEYAHPVETSTTAPGTTGGRSAPWLIGFVGGIAVGAGLLATLRPPRSAPENLPLRLSVEVPADAPLADVNQGMPTIAISPDGAHIVYVGTSAVGTQLYDRPIDRLDARPIPDTQDAVAPFFSSDSKWVGFEAEGRLKKVPISGGTSAIICDAPYLFGASWGSNGSILYSTGRGGLLQVSEGGGVPRSVTTPSTSKDELSHLWPSLLPDGKSALFTIRHTGSGQERFSVAILSLQTKEWNVLVNGATAPRYVASGHMLFARGASLLAARFDAKRLTVTGEPVPVLKEVRSNPAIMGVVDYDVSSQGSLVYAVGPEVSSRRGLYRVDRSGKVELLAPERQPYFHPAISPDGKRLAVNVQVEGANKSEIWVFDLARRFWTRLTSGQDDWEPVWLPGGRSLIFGRNYGSSWEELALPADGGAVPEVKGRIPKQLFGHALSHDGQFIAADVPTGTSAIDIWLLSLKDGSLAPFLVSAAAKVDLQFSPDDRWLAYASDESGRFDVYVKRVAPPRDIHLISRGFARYPVWAPDGQKIFYWGGRHRLMAVPLYADERFNVGDPATMLELPFDADFALDVFPEGKDFVALTTGSQSRSPLHIVVIPDFFGELTSHWKRASQ